MTASSFGPKGEPQFKDVDAPDVAVNPTQVAAYAALVGNRKAGTSADRKALTGVAVWPGLEYFETDTGSTFVYTAAGWINPDMQFAQFTTRAGGVPDGGPYQAGTVTAVGGKTVGGGFATLANNKITLVPGLYDITWTLKMNVAQPTTSRTGYVQFEVSGEPEAFRAEYGPGGDTATAKGSFLLLQPATPNFTFYKQGGGTPDVTGTIRIRKDA